MNLSSWQRAMLPLVCAVTLAGCGGDDDDSPAPSAPVADTVAPLTVPKPVACTSGDAPETALQGQVSAAARAAGFNGYSCNLKLVGQSQNEGGNWSSATFTDGAGHTCAYHASAVPNANRKNPGVPIIDMTDRAKPTRVASLTTPAMTDPWESLRVNQRRQLLIADNGQNGAGGPEVDIYDLSGDCRTPQLMASIAVGTGTDGGVAAPVKPIGHEGNIAVDGLTYYVGDTTNRIYNAVDLSNTTKPKVIASFDMKKLGLATHGLSISKDGNRMYGVSPGLPTIAQVNDPNYSSINGFVVLDTSEVQARKANPQIRHIASALFKDGSVAQHTIPITVGGKPYIVMVDEGGSGGIAFDPPAHTAAAQAACNVGLPPFPTARIFDMSDETKPKEISKLMLETHDPKNCSAVLPDIAGLSIFTYGSHYCSVDNRDNATALACSYFNSGIRVFDIRNPLRPKEIAYFNPKSTSALPGSSHAVFNQWRAGGPDWCASRLDFDFANKQLTTMCQDNGLLILQFESGWPFPESTASRDQS